MSEIKDNKDNFENTALDTEVENLFDETDASPEAARDAVLESMDKTKKRVKTAKKIGIAIAVVLLAFIIGLVVISASDSVKNSLVTAMMPKSITAGQTSNDKTFYVEKNDKYDKDKDEPIDAWKFYYIGGDDGKTKQYLDKGNYTSHVGGETQSVAAGFFLKANEKYNVVKNVLKVIVAIAVVALIAFLIWVWYLAFCLREDKKKLAKLDFDSATQQSFAEDEQPKRKKLKKSKKNKN